MLNRVYLRFILIGFMAVALSACEKTSMVKPQVDIPKFDLSKSVVLVAPATTIHKELLDVTQDIQFEYVRQLASYGVEVFEIKPSRFNKYHKVALNESGAIYDPNVKRFLPLKQREYVKKINELLSQDGRFDLLLLPELMLRPANIKKGVAYWDYGSEALPLIGTEEDIKNAEGGTTKGLSVRMRLYRLDGARILESYGAVILPFDINLKRGKPAYSLRIGELNTLQNLQVGVSRSLKYSVQK